MNSTSSFKNLMIALGLAVASVLAVVPAAMAMGQSGATARVARADANRDDGARIDELRSTIRELQKQVADLEQRTSRMRPER
ncbi:hypothetical protein [Sphaerotilus uruguayifluvii]|uniref:TolA-binding protein n=1 Tax=Sphaerotilus uruguayifluvii TaxID=2735897 RepID=A0ABX2G2I0_9BURK|nr:hypothetical protein [Leptothrix sp. C29]NRT56230.1 TolA-binding protein [Leptothrix sp. C29]